MKLFRIITVFVFGLFVAGIASAQSQEGRILGTVIDQSGGFIKGAQVTITNVDTGVERKLETNEAGDFVAPSLAPGPYKLVVEAAGFKKIERGGIRLEVAKDVRLELTLQPGSVSETVTVTEQLPLVETTNDTLGGTFANKSINDLPLNGRDFQNLVVLRPGVQRSSGGGFLSISSNGNRPEDNNFIFDGTDNNDPYYGTTVINAEGVQGTPGTILPIDAIQEFNAQENPPAEYGWKPGAIVNLGIKSGTNDIHGTAYLFERNNAFDARNYFNPKIDPNTGLASPQRGLRQHQFGGSLGGPIIKNKTFVFGAYEGIRAQVSNSNGVEVPATASLGGDPGGSIPDALTDLMAHQGGAPTFTCAGVPVNSNALNPLSANLIGCGSFTGNGPYPGLLPANNGANGININSGFPNSNRMDAFIVKADHHFNERHSISGRYFFGDSLQTEQDITVLRPEWESQSDLRAQVLGFNYTWVPNARWVNEARFGWNSFWQTILTADHAKNPVTGFGINTGVTAPINFGMPTILISPFTQIGGNSGWPLETTPNVTYQFLDNISYSRGKHTFHFGGEYRRGSTDNIRDRRGKGRVRFQNGGNTFGTSTPLEDFLAGNPDKGDIFVGNSERFVHLTSWGAFLQDDWRVTPRFTINAGVRYDYSSPIVEEKNRLGNFEPSVGLEQVGVNIGTPYRPDRNNFSPRLGFSWDPFGKGKTIIRAGGSIIYEIPHMAVFLGQNGVNNATTPGLNVIPTGATGSNLLGNGGTIAAAATTQSTLNWSVAGPVFNAALNCDPNNGGSPCDILAVNRNLRTPYVATWNVNIQQQLTPTTSLQVGYVGNHGIKLYGIRDINQVNTSLDDGSEQLGRPFTASCPVAQGGLALGGPCFPFLGFVNFMDNGDTSIYHGLQSTLTQRVWKGMNFVAGYTWAHAIDDVSLNRAQQPQDSTRPGLERASGDNDIRHRFTLALTYDVPGRKGYAQLLEGWQLNSIVTLQTGPPFTGYDFENDVSLTGEFSDRWNIIGNPANIKWGKNQGVPFFPGTSNSACVSAANTPELLSSLSSFGCYAQGGTLLIPPAVGTFGNLGRNTFRASGLYNWDFSIVKSFRFGERVSAQLRGEFFNVLNHPEFANPAILFNNDLGLGGVFGMSNATPDVAAANPVIGTGGPRNIQLGLKFRF